MTLHLEDREVVDLAHRLADLRKVSVKEAVRTALEHELASAGAEVRKRDFRKTVAYLQERARNMTGPNPQPVTKEWIDSLYEDD